MTTGRFRVVVNPCVVPSQPFKPGPTCIRHFTYACATSRLFLQLLLCVASAVLGFRMSQQASLVVLQFSRHSEYSQRLRDHPKLNPAFANSVSNASMLEETTEDDSWLPNPDFRLPAAPGAGNVTSAEITAGVQVGRHQILIRDWPHPDPKDSMKAHRLIARVQQEQELLHCVRDWKPVIAITPTFPRVFQALHLTGLMHTLSLVRGPVIWIIIEAGGVSNDTAELLAEAKVHNVVHLGYARPMPVAFEARWILESHLRVEGLRFVREKQLEGVIVFADDSNGYSLRFFDLAQTVKWVGVVPMGILGYAGFQDAGSPNFKRKRKRRGSLLLGILRKGQVAPKLDLQVQTLARDGWHAHRPLPLDWDSGKGTKLLDEKLQWAGFVMNSRILWASDRPHWLQDWKGWTRLEDGVYLDFRSIFMDESQVEELLFPDWGSHQVRHWWIRMEGRPDCKFPARWALNSQPTILLPTRSTPWREEVLGSISNSTSQLSVSQTLKIRARKKSRKREGKSKPKRQETSSETSTAIHRE